MFRAHASLQGQCETSLVCSHIAGQLAKGWRQLGRLKITDELRRVVEVDNREAMKIGANKVVRHQFHTAVFSGMDELTPQRREAGMLVDTAIVVVAIGGNHRMLDEDWHEAVCQGHPQGEEWENLLQVGGHEQGGQCPQPRREAAGQTCSRM